MNDNITIKIKNLNLYLNNDIGFKHENTIQIPKSLEEYSWKEIDEIVKRGLHTKLFRLGDRKLFKLGDETLIAQIADFDHDDKTDGTGKAGISFILKDCMNTVHEMNSIDVNINGWSGSEMYSYLNTDIYNQLPSDLQSVIKPVDKVTGVGGESTKIQTSSDKLWLMSRVEAFGGSNTSYTPNGEGSQYPIFTDNANRIKKVNGSNNWYWLRSPFVGYSAYFCGVSSGGNLSYNIASGSFGVVFGFCI